MEKLKIVIAVDSFKGSATSKEVEEYIENGILKYKRDIIIKKIPIADGGEGTVEAVVEATSGEYKYLEVNGPLGEVVKAKFGIIKNKIAIMEMAESSGINLISHEKLNPYKATTYGVGQVLKKILDMGIEEIYIGIGGSATNDGGAGMLAALGAKFYDSQNNEIGYTPIELKRLSRIDLTNFDSRIKKVKIRILSDVRNILCGKNGASYIYGPQKGASKEDIVTLDSILNNYGNIIDKYLNEKNSMKAGSGAAGGLGYALLSVCKAEFNEGIIKIMELLEIEKNIKDANLVITGEGRIDNQSVNGKAPVGIALTAKKYNIPVIAIVGSSDKNLTDIYKSGIDLVLDIINEPMTLDKAIKNVKELLEFTGEKAIRAFCLGK